jgi:hypothetical protein
MAPNCWKSKHSKRGVLLLTVSLLTGLASGTGCKKEKPPVPLFTITISPEECTLPCTVSMGSSDGGIRTYFWDFGDGSTSTQAAPAHTYYRPGLFHIRAEATTTGGQALADSAEVRVLPPFFPAASGTYQCQIPGFTYTTHIRLDTVPGSPDRILLHFSQPDESCVLSWYESSSFYEDEGACTGYPMTLTVTSDSTLRYSVLANNPVTHECVKGE